MLLPLYMLTRASVMLSHLLLWSVSDSLLLAVQHATAHPCRTCVHTTSLDDAMMRLLAMYSRVFYLLLSCCWYLRCCMEIIMRLPIVIAHNKHNTTQHNTAKQNSTTTTQQHRDMRYMASHSMTRHSPEMCAIPSHPIPSHRIPSSRDIPCHAMCVCCLSPVVSCHTVHL